jgi:hypothetical protein
MVGIKILEMFVRLCVLVQIFVCWVVSSQELMLVMETGSMNIWRVKVLNIIFGRFQTQDILQKKEINPLHIME